MIYSFQNLLAPDITIFTTMRGVCLIQELIIESGDLVYFLFSEVVREMIHNDKEIKFTKGLHIRRGILLARALLITYNGSIQELTKLSY